MIKLTILHIEDLTTPRYVEKPVWNDTKKGIIDTHAYPQPILNVFDKSEDIQDILDIMNAHYHNHIIRHLGFDLSLGPVMQGINRSEW